MRAHATDPSPKRLTKALGQLCEREGLDPCEAACVIVEGLAWTPRLPHGPKRLLQVVGIDRSRAPAMDRTELVRRRAYEIWLAEGRPDGRTLEHWCRAEAEFKRN